MLSCWALQRLYEKFYMANCPRPSQAKKDDPNNQPLMRAILTEIGCVMPCTLNLRDLVNSWIRGLGEERDHDHSQSYDLGDTINKRGRASSAESLYL